MKNKHQWIEVVMAISYQLSCFILAINSIYIAIDLYIGNNVPARNLVIAFVTILIWAVIIYATVEPWWKTMLRMHCYTFALIGVFLFLLSLTILVNLFLRPENEVNIYLIPILALVAGALYFGCIRALKSNLLK